MHLSKQWMEDVLIGLKDEIRLFPFDGKQKREANQALADLSFLFIESTEAVKHFKVIDEIFEILEGLDIEEEIIKRQNETAG